MNSSRKSTPWCASDTSPGRRNVDPPPRSPASETEWCGARNGPERQHASLPEQPGDRVELGRLERLFARELRQDRREPPRQHRLARAGRADHEQVVTARRGDLERPPRLRLAAHLGEVDRRPLRRPRSRSARRRRAPRSRGGTRPRRRAWRAPTTRSDLDLGRLDARSPRARRRRSSPARAAAIATERIPGVGSSSPLSDSSPANAKPTTARRGHLRGGGEHAHRDREVEARAPPSAGSPARGSRRRDAAATRDPRSRPPAGSGRARRAPPRPGSPVKMSDGSPRPTYASTVTRCPPTPSTVTPTHAPVHDRGRYSRGTDTAAASIRACPSASTGIPSPS